MSSQQATGGRLVTVMRLVVALWLLPVPALYAMDFPKFVHDIQCGLQTDFNLSANFLYEGFFHCSTVLQSIEYADSKNIKIVDDISGVSYIAPLDEQDDAIVVVKLKNEYNDYIFFPRVSSDSSISVEEEDSQRNLFYLENDISWTPVGRRYIVDLYCSKYGYLKKQVDVTLRITLSGKSAQLWLPENQVFFR